MGVVCCWACLLFGGKIENKMADFRSKVLHDLNEAQNGLHQHHKLVKSLKSTLEQDSPSTKAFFDIFYPPILNVLLVLKREPAVERLVEFIAKFAVAVAPKRQAREAEDEEEESSTSDSEEDDECNQHNFLHILIANLMNFLEAKDKAVRFRTCQIFSKIFSYMFSDSAHQIKLSSTLSNALADLLLERLKDRFHLVRLYAVSALAYLQDPTDADCVVLAALTWSMEHDSSYEVRKCALINIMITMTSLLSVIERTRDTKDLVRRCAFLTLAEKCSIRNLSIQQRLQIVNDGLKDESPQVREACTGGLLRSWCIDLDEDLLQLLKRLDVENSPKVAELVLMSLFDEIEDNDLVSSFESNLPQVPIEEQEGDQVRSNNNFHRQLYIKILLNFHFFFWPN